MDKLFENDKDYQEVVKAYKDYLSGFDRYLNEGYHDKGNLTKMASYIENNLQQKIKELHMNKKQELQNKLSELEKQAAPIGLSERQADAEEMKLKFKIADDNELRDIVSELNTTDLLELSLLRSELQDRGLSESDRTVKNHIIKNRLQKDPEVEKQIEETQKKLSVINTLPNSAFYVDGELKTMKGISNELNNKLKMYEPREYTNQDFVNELKSNSLNM